MLKERPELFIQDDTVRPGILVLVNDADWELMVGYVLNKNQKLSIDIRLFLKKNYLDKITLYSNLSVKVSFGKFILLRIILTQIIYSSQTLSKINIAYNYALIQKEDS